MKTINKAARDIVPGDKVMTEDGIAVTVRAVEPGLWRNSVTLKFKERIEPRWSCVNKGTRLEIA